MIHGIAPRPTATTVKKERKSKDAQLKLKENDLNDLIELKRKKFIKEKNFAFLYRQIGMVLSLAMVVVAFNWKTYDEGDIMSLGEINSDLDEIIEIPINEQPPPPPPKVETFTIKEIDNNAAEVEEVDVLLDVEMTADEEVETVDYVAPVFEEVEEEVDEIFTVVEQQSEPVGGNEAFQRYLAENLAYPNKAARLGIQGRVFVKFVVEKDGSLTDIQIVKGIGAGCDEEAIRVISKAAKWKPGKQRGKTVRTYRIIPINFVLKQN